MIGLSSKHKYYFYTAACDMRKGFDGLSGIVTNLMGMNPLDGSVYVFINRGRNRMKMLVYEQGGFMLYYKRLEKGYFEQIVSRNSRSIQINWEDLVLLIQGIKRKEIKRLKRYHRA